MNRVWSVLAVHIDRQDPLRGLPDLVEDVADAGHLPGPREPAENQVCGPGPEEYRFNRVGHLPEMGVPVIELLREITRFESIPVLE
jgi:hypothetical protein